MARRPGLYPLDRAAFDPRLTPIAPEADAGFAAGVDLDDDDGDAFARLREVGRLLDTVRVVDQLRELGALDPGQLRDLSQWIEGGGLAAGQARWPNAFWGSRQGGGDPLGDLRIPGLSNLGASETLGNAGSGFGMDHRDYDTSDEPGSRDPFGLRAGLASQGGTEPGPVDYALGKQVREAYVEYSAWVARASGASTEEAALAGKAAGIIWDKFYERYGGHAMLQVPDIGEWGTAPPPEDPVPGPRWSPFERWPFPRGWERPPTGDPGPDGESPGLHALAGALLARVRSPGIKWRTARSEGGSARTRPADPDTNGAGELGPRFAMHRGGLVDVERRTAGAGLAADAAVRHLERFIGRR